MQPARTLEEILAEFLSLAVELPTAELEELVESEKLPAQVLGAVCERLIEQGSPRRALRLLEPIFEKPQDLDESHARALDALFMAYGELGFHRKEAATLKRLAVELRPPLSARLWIRCAVLSAKGGRFSIAWSFCYRARLEDPEEPGLVNLEIDLLMAEGRVEQAVERARAHARGLRRSPSADPDPLQLDYLDRIVADPLRAALTASATPAEVEPLERFLAVARALPERPVRPYRLEPEGEGEGARLATPAAVLEAERAWTEVWPLERPLAALGLDDGDASPWRPAVVPGWLEALEQRPETLDSLAVLDDLCRAVDPLDGLTPRAVLDRALLAPILDRAEALLEPVLAAGPRRLAWDRVENRPALRLLAERIYFCERLGEEAGAEAITPRMERLLELDPGDPLGVRASLVDRYLRAGDDERALALAGRYPEDRQHAEIVYAPVLALYRLGRPGDARAALAEAHRQLPRVADYLTGRRRRRPRLSPAGARPGSPGQAWLYRQEAGDLWEGVPRLLDLVKKAIRDLRARQA